MSVFNITYPLPHDFDIKQEEDFFTHLYDVVVSSVIHSAPDSDEMELALIVQSLDDLPQLASQIGGFIGRKLTVDDFQVEDITDIDWLENTYHSVEPFSVGRFFLQSNDYKGVVPEDKLGLCIDASVAFGSGEHGTTAGCLELFDAIPKVPGTVLDMGTGSGILAIAAHKLWSCSVLAVDIEQNSVDLSIVHNALNHIEDGAISTLLGDGFNTPEVHQRAPYDLVMANILAGPLREMAADLVSSIGSNGYAILSGMLEDQVDEISALYCGLGLAELCRVIHGEWAALMLHKLM